MARFSEFGITHDAVIGRKIEIEELFDKRILIEKTIIADSKYSGRNMSGLRMQMQVVFATFNAEPDVNGDYFVKGSDGLAVGERRSCFTGSDNLINTIKKAEESLPGINARRAADGLPPISVYPLDVTITRAGKGFLFQ